MRRGRPIVGSKHLPTRLGVLVAAAGVLAGFREARAEDDPLLDVEAPPTMPSLTKREATGELVYAGAGVGRAGGESQATGTTFLWMSHLEGEVPLTTRAWHAGLAWDVASAAAPGAGRAFLYGNPELWARGVGWHESGLSAGGTLGVVLPLPREEGDESLRDAVRVVRPWDTGYFSEILTARPAFDARLILRPFVLQVRQGLDLSYALDEERFDIVGRVGTYAGWEPFDRITLGLELWQIYSVTADVRDDERAAFTLSPSIRMRLEPLEPGLSFLLPLSTPLEGIASAFFAVRVHVRLAFGDTAAVTYFP